MGSKWTWKKHKYTSIDENGNYIYDNQTASAKVIRRSNPKESYKIISLSDSGNNTTLKTASKLKSTLSSIKTKAKSVAIKVKSDITSATKDINTALNSRAKQIVNTSSTAAAKTYNTQLSVYNSCRERFDSISSDGVCVSEVNILYNELSDGKNALASAKNAISEYANVIKTVNESYGTNYSDNACNDCISNIEGHEETLSIRENALNNVANKMFNPNNWRRYDPLHYVFVDPDTGKETNYIETASCLMLYGIITVQ